MDKWSEVSEERKSVLLRDLSAGELVERFGGTEAYYGSLKEGCWEALRLDKQYTLLKMTSSEELEARFGKPAAFFDEARGFVTYGGRFWLGSGGR